MKKIKLLYLLKKVNNHFIHLTTTILKFFLTLFFSLFLFSNAIVANDLKVVTRNLEPFSFVEFNTRKGYAIELWAEI